MSKTNCVNCGAAKEESDVKCPFCGTLYFDMTAIDFDSGEPVACVFVLPGGRQKMTMLAIPRLEEIAFEYSPRLFIDDFSRKTTSFIDSQELRVGLNFTAVCHPDGTVFKVMQDGVNKK